MRPTQNHPGSHFHSGHSPGALGQKGTELCEQAPRLFPCHPSPCHTLHRDFHKLVVFDAPQGLDVVRCCHGPAAPAGFLSGKRVGRGKVSRPGPHPPSPRADWADWADTWFLMDEMMFVALRQSQLGGTSPPDFSDPAFLTILGILSGAL